VPITFIYFYAVDFHQQVLVLL